MTSVNVDSEKAKEERKMLLKTADMLDFIMKKKNRRCFVCPGHGAISVLKDGKLAEFGVTFRYGDESNRTAGG